MPLGRHESGNSRVKPHWQWLLTSRGPEIPQITFGRRYLWAVVKSACDEVSACTCQLSRQHWQAAGSRQPAALAAAGIFLDVDILPLDGRSRTGR